ncbi:MAG: HlyD family efflux transporter periplasmic adaptor subunit [Planctomycetia bacterium]|nr:HlyD family efflux transporter periplasmic adaptor subunit [Planctomycetia bacterium]
MTTKLSPLSPTMIETTFNPSRVLETDTMQKDLLPTTVTSELAMSTAYPVAPTHIVHVSHEIIPSPSYDVQAQTTSRRLWIPYAFTALVALGAGYLWFRPAPGVVSITEPPLTLISATKAPLDVCLIEQGVIESNSTVLITNPITSAPVTVTSMVPYGTRVKKGDVIAKLDLSSLHSTMADQQSKILAARMKLQEAQEALDALKTKNEGELASMDLQMEFAQSDLNRYVNEEKQVELNDRRGQISMAERDLREAEEKMSYFRTFHKRGFISSEQLKAKEAELERSRFALAQNQSRLKIYERYMVPRQERTLQAKVDELKREYSKLKKTQSAALLKAQNDITTCKAGLTSEENKLTLLQTQLANVEVIAPRDGIVAAPPAEAQKTRPAQGSTLQPSQAIFSMPQLDKVCVKVRLGESEMRKLQTRQKARITLDDESGAQYQGTLEKVDFQAESTWTRPDGQPKDFVALVSITNNEPLDWTYLGQKARVEFTLDTLPDALQVPASAITEKEGRSYVMVMTRDGLMPRELRTGCTDGKKVEIRQGLEPGEKVVVSSKLKLNETVDIQPAKLVVATP